MDFGVKVLGQLPSCDWWSMKQAHSQASPITLVEKRSPDHLHVKKLQPCFLPSPQPDEVPSFEITTITNIATIFQVVRSTQAKLSYDSPSPTTTRPGKWPEAKSYNRAEVASHVGKWLFFFLFFCVLNFLFCIGVQPINDVVIVSG